MSYAVIRVGGKQYRVQEGERLLVDRLATAAGKTFTPDVLLADGDLDSKSVVTAKVLDHVKGEKIRIGKYRPKSGYRKHTGFRASLTRIEIESIGARKAAAKHAPEKAEKPAHTTEGHAGEKAETPAPKGLPKDYAGMTVADIHEAAPHWNRPMLEAALAYEHEHGKRKGALAAIESALAAKEEKS
jgi:large subunit ribosomal protein L21